MQALLIRADLWEYADGTTVKPEPTADDAKVAQITAWMKNDQKARSEMVLSISPAELKQIKTCVTAREAWSKLEDIYQSKGPARKATLLKKLTLYKMAEGSDVRDHLNEFFDTVDKLAEMDIAINEDLLTIMLLYSLPPRFENFRCAIESRDALPTPEALRTKIVEENDARKGDSREDTSKAMFVNKNGGRGSHTPKHESNSSDTGKARGPSEIRCYVCKRPGHKKSECRYNKSKGNTAQCASKDICLNTSTCQIVEKNRDWCLDSGATVHLCNNEQTFCEVTDSSRGVLNLANHLTSEITGKGKVRFTAKNPDSVKNVMIEDVSRAPDLRTSLMSVAKITDRDYEVTFRKDGATVVNPSGNVELHADRIGDLYYIREHDERQSVCSATCAKPSSVSLELIHRRFGHADMRNITDAVNKHAISGIEIKSPSTAPNCDVCLKGKMTRAAFPKKSDRSTEICDLIHTDVCGPMRVASLGGARYYVEFIDDCSKWCEVRFLKSKSEVLDATKAYIALVEKQTGRSVRSLQSDGGREYINNEFDSYLKERGITRRVTVPHNPEQNGTAERQNRTLMETARCMLMEAGLPDRYWAEAVNTAAYLRNRLPKRSLNGKTPCEVWTGKIPDASKLRVFGCRVFYLDRDPGKGKLDQRGQEGIFLGYSAESNAFRIWSDDKKKVLISRDVRFIEEHKLEVQGTNKVKEDSTDAEPENSHRLIELDTEPRLTKNDDEHAHQDSDEEDEFMGFDNAQQDRLPLCPKESSGGETQDKPTNKPGGSKVKKVDQPRAVGTRTGLRSSTKAALAFNESIFLTEIPLKEAISGPDSTEWLDAMATEMKSIIKNETWILVDRPSQEKVIGSRMTLRNKLKPDGTIEKRKARLVAQGFSQQPGVHFLETFAPVARFSSIRLVAALAAEYNLKIRQFDIAAAYLHGRLDEEIFMDTPKRFEETLQRVIDSEEKTPIGKKARQMLDDFRRGNKVCLLKKALYGLRQAGRNWHLRLTETLKKMGAIQSDSDPCLFRIDSGEDLTLIIFYVDDILVASKSEDVVRRIKRALSSEFEVKDLGKAKYCLGVEFCQSGQQISMSQRGYILELLERFGMSNCKPVATPIDAGSKLKKSETSSSEVDKLPYRELIGALTYLSTTTRPDISFAISSLGQFNNCYGTEHWTAAKRVLRYLKGTLDVGLVFSPHSEPVRGYVDADWGGSTLDRKSHSGFMFLLGGSPISWDSRKQRTVALSTTEAEYMALAECAKEAIYLKRFICELGFNKLANLKVFCDNQSAISLAENPTYHARSKHIDIRHHFVRDVVNEKTLILEHVSTEEQAADFLTKGLPKAKHQWCMKKSGLRDIN